MRVARAPAGIVGGGGLDGRRLIVDIDSETSDARFAIADAAAPPRESGRISVSPRSPLLGEKKMCRPYGTLHE
jgi:hypothetical protein